MIRRPPRSTRTDTLFPYTTLFRSLPFVGSELSQHDRWRDMAGLDRPYEAQHVFPLLTDDVGADTLAQQRGDGRIGRERRDRREPPVGEVAQARAEAERSDERRVGQECVRTCRYRWLPDHSKKKK